MKICKERKCSNKVQGLGYCNRHYQQFWKHGKTFEISSCEPNKIILKINYALIKLYNKKQEIIGYSKIDLIWVKKVEKYRWSLSSYGYVRNYKIGFLHHLITGRKPTKGKHCDHINRDRLDNREKNLRIISHSANLLNSLKRKSNKLGIKCVHYSERDKEYCYQKTIKGTIYTKCSINLKWLIEHKEQYEMRMLGYVI